MLHKSRAVQALLPGCSSLGLPASTAAALVQFLAVKRTHDQFVPDKDRQLRMSPGATLDKLWHYILLNTSVSSVVHEQLGGVVEHRGSDAWELPDDTKLLQRLYALNIMRLEGHQPDVTLWTEANTSTTAMHALHLTTEPVAALQSLPGGGRLYVTPSLTQQQQGRLVAALQALYAQDTQQQPADAPAVPAAPAVTRPAANRGVEPAAKRARVEQQQQEQEQEQQGEQQQQQQQQRAPGTGASKLTITVKDALGAAINFTVKPHTPLRKVFTTYAEHKGSISVNFDFVFGGQRISSSSDLTPQQLGMQDGDVIHCFNAAAC